MTEKVTPFCFVLCTRLLLPWMLRLKDLEAEQSKLFAEFEQKMKQQREQALADIIEPLKQERIELCQQVNDANSRISEIDRELAKLTGKEQKQKPVAGKRHRRNAEELESERKELLAMGSKLYGVLKKAGKDVKVQVGELSKISLGIPVKKALQVHIDNGLVGFHPNGPKPFYSYAKDGSVA